MLVTMLMLKMKVTTMDMRTSTSILSSGLCRDFLGFEFSGHIILFVGLCPDAVTYMMEIAFANLMTWWNDMVRISKRTPSSPLLSSHHDGFIEMTSTCEWKLSEQKRVARLSEDFPLIPPSNRLH